MKQQQNKGNRNSSTKLPKRKYTHQQSQYTRHKGAWRDLKTRRSGNKIKFLPHCRNMNISRVRNTNTCSIAAQQWTATENSQLAALIFRVAPERNSRSLAFCCGELLVLSVKHGGESPSLGRERLKRACAQSLAAVVEAWWWDGAGIGCQQPLPAAVIALCLTWDKSAQGAPPWAAWSRWTWQSAGNKAGGTGSFRETTSKPIGVKKAVVLVLGVSRYFFVVVVVVIVIIIIIIIISSSTSTSIIIVVVVVVVVVTIITIASSLSPSIFFITTSSPSSPFFPNLSVSVLAHERQQLVRVLRVVRVGFHVADRQVFQNLLHVGFKPHVNHAVGLATNANQSGLAKSVSPKCPDTNPSRPIEFPKNPSVRWIDPVHSRLISDFAHGKNSNSFKRVWKSFKRIWNSFKRVCVFSYFLFSSGKSHICATRSSGEVQTKNAPACARTHLIKHDVRTAIEN